MLYISLDSYTRDDIERICELPQVHGALLGDLFCQRRMFEGGAPELWKMAKNLTAARKRVIYQTPFYLTERYYEGELLQIRSLAQSDILHGLIVQDIGLLDEINQMKRKGILPNLPLIWNCIAIGRSRTSNALYYQTVAELGADFIETADTNVYRALQAGGFHPVYVDGRMQYRTMNRECFYKYQNNIFDHHCDRRCLSDQQWLVAENGEFRMSVDGHVLGKTYLYDSDPEILQKAQDIFLYAKDLDDATGRLGSF